MVRHCRYLAPLAAVMLMAVPAHGQGNAVRQGVLTCQMSASIGLIVGSTPTASLPVQIRRGMGPELQRRHQSHWP